VRRNQHDVNGGYDEGGRAILQYTPTDALNCVPLCARKRFLDDAVKPLAYSNGGRQISGMASSRKLSSNSVSITLQASTTQDSQTSDIDFDYEKEKLSRYGFYQATPRGDRSRPEHRQLLHNHDSTKSSQELTVLVQRSYDLEWTIGGFFLAYPPRAKFRFGITAF